jgi:outer membrane protein assembly factor BamB
LVCCGAETTAADQRDLAARVLADSGVKGGLIVHVGCGDGRLTAALRINERYLVQGLDTDAANIEKARLTIRGLNVYGPVSVGHFDGTHLPYIDNVVNLVVVASDKWQVASEEITRVLAPGGVAIFIAMDNGRRTTDRIIKPWPEGIDDWTHYLHGPDNNAVAMDTRVGPPRLLQWKSDPLWCRSHNGVGSSIALVLSAGGRLFSVIDEGLIGQPGLPDRWTLVARDGFNGKLLWKQRLTRPSKRSLVAGDEKLYLISANRELTILDGATGRVLRTCENTRGADEVVCAEGIVVVHLAGKRSEGHVVCGVDADSGQTVWRAPAKSFSSGSLAATDGQAYYNTGGEIVCLDLHKGDERWRTPCKSGRGATIMIYQGVVFSTAGGLRAFAADTGEPLWKGPSVNARLGAFGASGLIWLTDLQESGRTFLWTPAPVVSKGYDPKTGEVRRTVTVPRLITPGHHVRCYSAKATDRYLLLPKRGVEFVDLVGEDHMRHDWLRAPCGHGVMAANGLLYVPPHQCFCYPGVKLTGFNGLSADTGKQPSVKPATDRLMRGPAYGQIENRQSAIANPNDWPMYRHDALRSGCAGCDLPVQLEPLWKRKLGGPISQPVVADGLLFTAEQETHAIRCLRADTGEPLWRYTTDGRIDSPPTLHQGLVLFGSTDGWVYCLRAADGLLVWRFQAAPGRRRIIAFDQLESIWPVHGSVLVQDGKVYCTAGRSSYLDGGMWVYALEPKTGEVLHEAHLESPDPDVSKTAGRPFDMEGARSDLLVSDGTDIYMFFQRFAPDLTLKPSPRITKLGDRQVGLHLMSNAGFLDTSWFDRNFWTYSARWPGFYFGYQAPKVGQILVFDQENTYGLHVFTERQGHSPRFWPGTDGYELFADSNRSEPVLRPESIGREKGIGYSRTLPPKWTVRIPVRARAMVLSPKHLYLAGPPDVVLKDDPMAAFEGRAGGRLWVVSTEDGGRLADYSLEHPPVFDGMSAAQGRLYLATTDGSVMCMGAKK